MIHWEPLTNTGSTLQSPLSSFAMRGTFSLCRAQDVCTSDPHYRTKPRYSEYIRPGSFDSLYVHSEDRLLTTMNFQQRWMTLGLATFSLHFQVDMVLELGFTNQTKMVQQARKVEKKKKKKRGGHRLLPSEELCAYQIVLAYMETENTTNHANKPYLSHPELTMIVHDSGVRELKV